MPETIQLQLSDENISNLKHFSEILKKEYNTLLNEALENYFNEVQKALLEKNLNDENMMTNLDYDEFWDGVEL